MIKLNSVTKLCAIYFTCIYIINLHCQLLKMTCLMLCLRYEFTCWPCLSVFIYNKYILCSLFAVYNLESHILTYVHTQGTHNNLITTHMEGCRRGSRGRGKGASPPPPPLSPQKQGGQTPHTQKQK